MEARRRKAGVSLVEVLISIFVISIGLLGLAALIPVGSFAILESSKADRSGACGRAGLSEVKIRRMLDYRRWSDTAPAAAGQPFAIDPLGVAHGVTWDLGPLPRITLNSLVSGAPMTPAEANRVFIWHDDLTFTLPENMEPPPADGSTRPRLLLDGSGVPQFEGDYSWVLTVTPAAAEADLPLPDKKLYTVSVVVRYGRNPRIEADEALKEHTADVSFLGTGLGGGGVKLSWTTSFEPLPKLKENEWIMLAGGGHCQWYRVVSAEAGTLPTYLTLAGPDWDITIPATAVVVDHVVGVYTSAVEVERSPLWTK